MDALLAPASQPSLTQRAANLNRPLVQLTPPPFDTTQIPENLFTHTAQRPGISTEEEKQRSGVIRAPGKVTVMGPRGAPLQIEDTTGSEGVLLPGLNPNATLQGNEPIINPDRGLIAPQNLMSERAQREHPILTGLGQLGEGLTTPENLAILAGTMGWGELPAGARAALSTYFAAQGVKGSAENLQRGFDAYQHGDTAEAQRLWTIAAGSAALAGVAGVHGAREAGLVPRVRPLAINESKPTEASSLLNIPAEQPSDAQPALTASTPDVIEAPLDALEPPERTQPTAYGRQQAQLYANRLRNPIEREYAQSYLRSRASGAAAPERISSLDAHRANVLGSNVDEYLTRQAPKPLTERYPTDVLDDAKQELTAANDLASSFERPGRFPVGQGDEIHAVDRDRWMGVGSSRNMISDLFPWYSDESMSPAKLADAVKRGKGANYDRIVSHIADHIQTQRTEAAPIIEEFAPQLESLASQVRDVDPELSQTLLDIRSGRYSAIRNLPAFIAEKVTDAQRAAQFSQAFDELAEAETGNAVPTGSQEGAEPNGGTREGSGGEKEAEVPFELTPTRTSRPQPVESQPALPGLSGAINEQRTAASLLRGEQLTDELNRPENIDSRAGLLERESPLFRSTDASFQNEIFAPRKPAQDYADVGKHLGVDYLGVMGEDLGDRAVALYQDPKSRTSFGVKLGEWSPERVEEKLRDARARMNGETTAYAGLGFLDPAIIRRVMPEALKHALSEGIPLGQREAGIVREKTGELARSKEQVFRQYADAMARWEKRPVQDGRDFILREQRGQKQPNAADQSVADNLQAEFAKRRTQIEKLPRGSFDHWRENYFPQMWERPNQVAQFVKQRILGGKRPLQGPASFKKSRVFDDLQAGIDAGFKPLTNNPVAMGLLKLHELDRYIMAHEILGQSVKEGLAKFVRFGERPPDGWTRVNDSMFRVLQPSEEAKGMVLRGEYYMPADAARVLNNYLSPGLRGNTAYDIFRKAGNTLNQAQLGISAFHLGFTSLDASVSDMALAIERASRGEVIRSLKPAARSLTVLGSPINTILRGNKLLKEYLTPGRYAEMGKLADAVAQAGGRVHMDPFYKNSAIESFWRAFQSHEYGRSLLRAFPAAIEYAAKPIMEVIVPRQKLGVFANLAEDVLRRADKEGWSRERRRLELNRAWDSVDNRMGQLVYDNLFWNRAVKDLGLVSVRSLGWNLGTIREVGGGGVDFAKQLGRLSTGERAQVTHRMAYVMALPIVVGFTGAMIHYLSTGKRPESPTDYFFPQTGRLDADGNPERLSLPSYVKDIVHYTKDPQRAVTNKLHPLLSMLAEMLQNRDFYGVEIRHSDDPLVRQAGQLAAHAAKQFSPLSYRNLSQRARVQGREGVKGALREAISPAGLESFIGITPAPRYISRTPAEQQAIELNERRRPRGTRTSTEFELSQRRTYLRGELAAGRMTPEQFAQHVRSGELTPKEAGALLKQSHEAPIVRYTRSLPLTDFLDVWDRADERERAQLRPLLITKRHLIANLPPVERRGMLDRINRALGTQPRPELMPSTAPLLSPQTESYQ
jgi:hypothetical protein